MGEMKLFTQETIDADIMSDREPEGLVHDGQWAIFLEPYCPEAFGYALHVYKNCAAKTEVFCWMDRSDLEWMRERIDQLLEM